MEILGQDENIFSINSPSLGVLNNFSPALKEEWISGKNSSNAFKILCTFQRKIPEFHKNSPLSTNTFASSRSGFSVNVLALVNEAIF